MELVEAFIAHPIVWGVITLLFAAAAFSGRLSMTAANVCLVAAWLTGIFGIYRALVVLNWTAVLHLLSTLFLASIWGFVLYAFSLWLLVPPSPAVTDKQQPPTVIQTGPTFGNLRQRAITLSNEIVQGLAMRGWAMRGPQSYQTPTDAEERLRWTRSVSRFFRTRFYARVLDIRNEFAQLHIRDQRLDDFFRHQGMIEDANRRMAAVGLRRRVDALVGRQQVIEVAERLRVLANQIQ